MKSSARLVRLTCAAWRAAIPQGAVSPATPSTREERARLIVLNPITSTHKPTEPRAGG